MDAHLRGREQKMRREIGMRQKYHRIVLILMLSVGILLAGKLPLVHAAFKLQINDLKDSVVEVDITDNGAGDQNLLAGTIAYYGAVGVFNISITTGVSKPQLGNSYEAIMDLSSLQVSTFGAGSLTISLSDTDYELIASSPPFGTAKTDMSGVTRGTIEYATFFDSTNKQFGTEVLLAEGEGSGAFSANPSLTVLLPSSPGKFSLTSIVTITHDAGDSSSINLDLSVSTPEPGTLLLLGTGLLGFAGYGWHRHKMQKP
jgi:hypothetical protein